MLCFCSHLFLRSVDIAAMDFLEQNGLADLIKLVVEENKVQFMPTIVFRFMIGSNVEQLKFDLSTVVFGSTLPFYSTELVEKNGTRSAWIQKPIFTCGKPNAYITNINGLFLPNTHSLFRSFGSEWLEERGDISGDMCSSCFKITNCTYISLVVLYI